jgi:hypothetical protein
MEPRGAADGKWGFEESIIKGCFIASSGLLKLFGVVESLAYKHSEA